MARDPLVTKPIIQLDDIVNEAQLAFWQEVVKHLPLAEGGDFDPISSHNFDLAIEEAITMWWRWNASRPYDLAVRTRYGESVILQGADCTCSREDDCQCEESEVNDG